MARAGKGMAAVTLSDQATLFPRITRSGDRAVTIEFSDQVSEVINLQVLSLDASLSANPFAGVLETVPTYRSLTIVYDPRIARGSTIADELIRRSNQTGTEITPGQLLEVPVVYGGEHQADLDELSQMKAISVNEIIDLHLSVEYRVYMIGFAPGFAYLGGLPEILYTPRLAVPRQRIEAGAIGIGGRQSSINSVPGPSGWRFIGRTPFKLFDPARQNPFLLKAGDRIRFQRIAADEAEQMDKQFARGNVELREIL